ncbi:MAG: sigma-70 family RNA polymerase sigma factor [Pseudomonadota bacterium]
MLDKTGEATLAMRAATGDGEAFAELLAQVYPMVFRLGCRLLGDRSEAEDLAQDIALGLARKIRGFRGEAAFSTWLYRLVVNAAHDRRRRVGRQARLAQDFADIDALRRAGDQARAAEAVWLSEALAALPDDLRTTAVLVLEEDMTQAQVAHVLGIAEGTVAWRMAEIKRRLRALAAREREAEAGAE